MLPPDHRQILLDILRPPAGYRLDAAVGTTFTLSFETALVVPLAFASFRLPDTSDPIAAMEAVRSAAERVDLFCQAGQMTVPTAASGLFAFLEPMVHEVRRPRPGHVFHPKVWFLRYFADDEVPALRLLCLSRNLTDDASWDVALRLDATEEGRPKAANRPLANFLSALPGMAVHSLDSSRRARVGRLAESARRAVWELPEHVGHHPRFWPLGLEGIKARPDFTGYSHLVIAPFLNSAGLESVAPPSASNVTVVSRAEDLDRLDPADLQRLEKTLVVNAAADLDDPDAPDGDFVDRDRLSGLHAKLYVVERNRAAHVFVGSANATDAAFGGNVEFLVELVGGSTHMGVDCLLDFDDGLGSILEQYYAEGGAKPDPVEEALRWLREALRKVAEARFRATVTRTGDDYFERLEAAPIALPDEVTLLVELVTLMGSSAPLTASSGLDATLGPLGLDQVTPFLVIHATTPGPSGEELRQATVVRCELVNDPAGRLDEILARQVDTPEKFLRFLLLVLGITDPSTFVGTDGSNGTGAWGFANRSNGIFELLARAVADRPDVLEDLDRLIPRLRATSTGTAVLPAGFDALWDVIQQARPALASLRAEA